MYWSLKLFSWISSDTTSLQELHYCLSELLIQHETKLLLHQSNRPLPGRPKKLVNFSMVKMVCMYIATPHVDFTVTLGRIFERDGMYMATNCRHTYDFQNYFVEASY